MNLYSGAIIGALLGFMASFGFIERNIKKSQRPGLFPAITIITTAFCAVSGGRLGYSLGRSDKINRSLGLDKIKQSHYKVGRFWESQSTWIDIKGGRHMVTTLKRNDETVSLYNGMLICVHGTSASSVNITKYHNEARNIAFRKLKERVSDNYIKYLSRS